MRNGICIFDREKRMVSIYDQHAYTPRTDGIFGLVTESAMPGRDEHGRFVAAGSDELDDETTDNDIPYGMHVVPGSDRFDQALFGNTWLEDSEEALQHREADDDETDPELTDNWIREKLKAAGFGFLFVGSAEETYDDHEPTDDRAEHHSSDDLVNEVDQHPSAFGVKLPRKWTLALDGETIVRRREWVGHRPQPVEQKAEWWDRRRDKINALAHRKVREEKSFDRKHLAGTPSAHNEEWILIRDFATNELTEGVLEEPCHGAEYFARLCRTCGVNEEFVERFGWSDYDLPSWELDELSELDQPWTNYWDWYDPALDRRHNHGFFNDPWDQSEIDEWQYVAA